MRALVLLLIFGLWPGASEAVVDVGHALMVAATPTAHGAHDGDHQSAKDEEGHDEHACSPLFHLCGCHPAPTSTPVTTAFALDARWREQRAPEGPAPRSPLLQPQDGARALVIRPPIA